MRFNTIKSQLTIASQKYQIMEIVQLGKGIWAHFINELNDDGEDTGDDAHENCTPTHSCHFH